MPSKADRRRRHDDDLGIYGVPGDVSPWDVRFDPSDRANVEPLGDGRLFVRVQTEPGLTDGALVVRSGLEIVSWDLEPAASSRFTTWTTTVGPFASVVEASLAFRSAAGRPVYAVPTGISASVERLDRWRLDPAAAPLDVPAWAQGAVIYQIFPERFFNGDPSIDPEGVESWGATTHSHLLQGGDLVGIREKLGYLAELGVDCLYLNPVFVSPSNHRYDVVDYHDVDPILGGNEALCDLVAAAHSRDMRVILDASFNHVHPHFFAFQDLLVTGPESPYRDWFVVHDWPPRIIHRPDAGGTRGPWLQHWVANSGLSLETVAGPGREVETTFDSWNNVPTMPRVNLANPAARAYMLDVATRWIEQAGIDGWRMDVVRYVDPDFWNDLRRAVKAVAPDTYLLAEVMGDAGDWLQGDRFDGIMNYTFRDLALAFFARDEIDGAGLLDGFARLMNRYAWSVTLANHNLLGSHDTPRFLTEADGDVDRMVLATVFQLTVPGAPGIYYGDEVGMLGGPDPHNRAAFPWELALHGHSLTDTIRGLTSLRRELPALRLGSWIPIGSLGSAVAYRRTWEGHRVDIVINLDDVAVTFDLGRQVSTVHLGEADVTGRRVRVAGGAAAVLS